MLPVASRGRPELRQSESHDRPWKGKGLKGKGKDKDGAAPSSTERHRPQKQRQDQGSPGSAWQRAPSHAQRAPTIRAHRQARSQACYGWNLEDGCHLPTSGYSPECERGLHVCMACGAADHGATSCPQQPKALLCIAPHVTPATEQHLPSPEEPPRPAAPGSLPSCTPPRPAVLSLESPQTETPKPTPADQILPGPIPSATDQLRHPQTYPVFIEVFCGIARLSQAARNKGFCIPIDHEASKSTA